MGIITVYKNIGETPLDSINKINSKGKKSYAGRLDPMAHGLLLILTENDCKNQENYHKLDKTYIFKLILDIETDTQDILGKVINYKTNTTILVETKVKDTLNLLKCKQNQKFPIYSSVRVNSKPLWYWAKNNLLSNIKIPEKEIEVYKLNLVDINTFSKECIKRIIKEKLDKLGDRKNAFREKDIKDGWDKFKFNDKYYVLKIEATVSSGTYIRELCRSISEKLDTIGIALDIYRSSIGEYKCPNNLK